MRVILGDLVAWQKGVFLYQSLFQYEKLLRLTINFLTIRKFRKLAIFKKKGMKLFSVRYLMKILRKIKSKSQHLKKAFNSFIY